MSIIMRFMLHTSVPCFDEHIFQVVSVHIVVDPESMFVFGGNGVMAINERGHNQQTETQV